MPRAAAPLLPLVDSSKKPATPLTVVPLDRVDAFRATLTREQNAWLDHTKFSGKAGVVGTLPGSTAGALAFVIVERTTLPWDYGNLAVRLPLGHYRLQDELDEEAATALALGWLLGSYRFDRYKKEKRPRSTLVWPAHADRSVALALGEGISLARDLVNTPASDLGPAELAEAAFSLAKKHDAKATQITGDALLHKNYPMVHAVGRASDRAPRLIELRWGNPKHPQLALVGKGVCFDTGGLDIKPAAFMKLMKKDMGGAALVLGLAHVIMSRRLPVALRVLIPAVENSVSGNAMRPLDVLPSRKGLTIEVGDTDAEGRLILADALTEADSESPDLLIDAATLTGAARVALGTHVPAVFATSTETWQHLERASESVSDPLWRLPLHRPYRARLESAVADLSNIGSDSYGGAITAALFLQEFISEGRDWLHVDTMGYNLDARPGRPVGGEALGLLALDRLLVERYPHSKGASRITHAHASKDVEARKTSKKTVSSQRSPATARSSQKRSRKS